MSKRIPEQLTRIKSMKTVKTKQETSIKNTKSSTPLRDFLKDKDMRRAVIAAIAMSFHDAYYRHIKNTKKEYTNRMDIRKIADSAASEFVDMVVKR